MSLTTDELQENN